MKHVGQLTVLSVWELVKCVSAHTYTLSNMYIKIHNVLTLISLIPFLCYLTWDRCFAIKFFAVMVELDTFD